VSAFSPARRAEVATRAGRRCEYCRLPTRGQVATFPIDHVIPRHAGGTTALDNLALTCPHCNAHKWTAVQEPDPDTGQPVRLFHPRQDVWEEHFAWAGGGVLAGLTPVGRATVAALQMNAPDMIELRALLVELGLFPDATG
jgi:hypothetical protein